MRRARSVAEREILSVRIFTNVRMMPCSVNARGWYLIFSPPFMITFCDLEAFASSAVSRNMKSIGHFSGPMPGYALHKRIGNPGCTQKRIQEVAV
jgi:hypothetical protein